MSAVGLIITVHQIVACIDTSSVHRLTSISPPVYNQQINKFESPTHTVGQYNSQGRNFSLKSGDTNSEGE